MWSPLSIEQAERRARYVQAARRTGYGGMSLRREETFAVVEFDPYGGTTRVPLRLTLECAISAFLDPGCAGENPVLVTVGRDHVTVSVRNAITGEWLAAIREHREGNFSHHITSIGIECAMFGEGTVSLK